MLRARIALRLEEMTDEMQAVVIVGFNAVDMHNLVVDQKTMRMSLADTGIPVEIIFIAEHEDADLIKAVELATGIKVTSENFRQSSESNQRYYRATADGKAVRENRKYTAMTMYAGMVAASLNGMQSSGLPPMQDVTPAVKPSAKPQERRRLKTKRGK